MVGVKPGEKEGGRDMAGKQVCKGRVVWTVHSKQNEDGNGDTETWLTATEWPGQWGQRIVSEFTLE